ncbi:MAG TPA: F0F1 ATP synthase subunit gamma [Mycobacteriales bacterium]|jgi:F-type H+-transporting ATPase subunit gamma|nr:F0F1 ATP synthase subunit gamma [Mycobacteriales bacterium]
MAAQIRVLRRRIRSVGSTKKITRAMELIAASRIVKAQQRVADSRPYANEITRVVTAMASTAGLDSPLTVEKENPTQAAVLIVTSDRGLAGAYNANVLKTAEELIIRLRQEGKEVSRYAIGRKAVGYFTFRGRPPTQSFTGFSEQPTYADAKAAAGAVLQAFLAEPGAEGAVDEIHLVYTEFVSALTQRPRAVRVVPLVVEQSTEQRPENLPSFEFEPSAEAVLEPLLPRYVESRVYAALLQSAASESASRQRAMKSATDNADELIKSLTREMNAARQAEITQEISEIVGGADALAASAES